MNNTVVVLMVCVLAIVAVLQAGCGHQSPPKASPTAPSSVASSTPGTSDGPVANRLDGDCRALQGVWICKRAEADGVVFPAKVAEAMRWTFKGETLILTLGGRDMECPYQLDPKHCPRHFDYKDSGSARPHIGIYELNGDTLRICVRLHGNSRPAEFSAKSFGEQLRYWVFERQKP
jgi:uncharacterized protein (TIGR03067 family)